MNEPAPKTKLLTASGILSALAIIGPLSILGAWVAASLQAHPHYDIGRKIFGNVPGPLKALFYVGVAAAVGLMFHLFSLRARNWQRGGEDRRSGKPLERLKRLEAGLSMRTLLRDRVAGLMHSMIYWGFLVLFVGTVILEIDNLVPESWKFLNGGFYQGYSFTLDLFALVFLGGLTFATVRRYGARPWRIRTKTKSEDMWILVTLAIIGVSGLAVEAARIRLEGRPSFETWSFVGYPLSLAVPQGSAAGIHQVLWVGHAVAFGAFLVMLPTTKLRHMVTSPANMYLSPRDRTKGAMREMPNLLEAADIETVGASRVGEFTWKQLFDTDACTMCGRCTAACPANLTGKPLDPREIVLKLGEVASRTAAVAVSPPVGVDMEITLGSDVVFERITPEEVFACTTCKACDDACPVDIEILDKILDMRRHLTLMESNVPQELGSAFLNMENSQNPWGMSQQSRGDWRDELEFDVPLLGVDTDSAEYLYWVGCSGSFDERNRKVTIATARLLHEAEVDFAILGPRELCSGDPARRSGNEYVFQGLALQNIETLADLGVRKVVTQCPHCFNTLANEYPQFGGEYEVVHHSQLLMDLVEQGRIVPKKGIDKRVAYHDPCYLGRHNDIYSPARTVLDSFVSDRVEMPRCGSEGLCCGAGGARMWMEESTGKRVNVERTQEAIATGATEIATSCPFCYVMLDDGVTELGGAAVVRDLSMMLAESALDPE
ncbi:MAG: heterodisulfide reductase-related iron-sulfur binding cluster [Acidimicrobiia bacterium]